MKLKPIILILFITVLILFSHQLQTFSQSGSTLSEIKAVNVSTGIKGLNSRHNFDLTENTAYIAFLDDHNLFQWAEPGDGCLYTQCGLLCCTNGCCPTKPTTCLGFTDCVTSSSSSSSSSSSGSSSSFSNNQSSSSGSTSSFSNNSSSSGGVSSSSSSSGGLSSSSSSSGGTSSSSLNISISSDNSIIPQILRPTTTITVEAEGLDGNTSCSLRSNQSLRAVRFSPRKFFLSTKKPSREVQIIIYRIFLKGDDLDITAKCGEDSTAEFNIMLNQQ